MARKIFVSYKHSDPHVAYLEGGENGTARDYVDVIEGLFDKTEIYKGERSGEDLSHLKDLAIKSQLRDQIFDSSVTVVLISRGMVTSMKAESEQFIPWEIAYSLKNMKRTNRATGAVRRSGSNALLAVVLPNETGGYGHFIQKPGCAGCTATTLLLNNTFPIIRAHFFNLKGLQSTTCPHCISYTGAHSYMPYVRWEDFILRPSDYIDIAVERRENLENYDLTKVPSDGILF